MASINTPNLEYNSQIQSALSSSPDGQTLGQSATDKIAFYGKVPYAQKVPSTGLNSSYVGALGTGTGTATTWGAQAVSVSGTATTWGVTSAVSGTLSVASNAAIVLTDVVNTLIGLGVWKAASA